MAVSVTCDLDLDLAKSQGARSDQVVHIRQGEAGCCTLRASVRSGQLQADLSGLTVELVGLNSRRELVEQAMASQSAGVWQCTLKSEWGSRTGLCMAYVRVSDGVGVVGTTDAFTISVAQGADMSEGEAAEYRRELDALMAALKDAQEKAASSKGEAADAAAAAKGSASAAAKDAAAAETSRKAAEASASKASGSAGDAKGSADAARTSAGEADGSAKAAATSASAASSAASAASDSATAAAQSASNLAELDATYRISEQQRAADESRRATAERTRAEAEADREAAEKTRAAAEKQRADEVVTSAAAETLAPGAAATASKDGHTLRLGIPRGETGTQGPRGETGATPSLSLTATVDASTGTPHVEVTRRGTDAAPTFDLAFTGLKAIGTAQPVPEYDEEAGRYTNASIAAWLGAMRDGKNYGVSIPKGAATDCTKTGANAGMANPVPGIVGRAAVDPYMGVGPFTFYEVNGGVDEDGTPYVTAIAGDPAFSRENDTWVMTPVLYTSETETDSEASLVVSDTRKAGMRAQPGACLPSGAVRPYMLYAKYALSVDASGKPCSVSGAPVKTRTVSHDAGVTLCKTGATGYSLRNSADDWYVKAMFLLKYATKNSQSVFAGCTGHYEQVNPTLAESGVTRVVVKKATAAAIPVGSAMMLGTHTGDSTDRGYSYNCDVFDGARVVRKEAVDDSNTAIYFDVAEPFDVQTTYLLSTAPWNTGSCDAVEGDGSPTSLTGGREPFSIQGIELGLGMYEAMGNVLLQSTGNGWTVWVNPDTRNEKAGGLASGAVSCGAFPGPASEGWNYGLYPRTVNGLMVQQGSGASTTTGVCDGNYKVADTVVGLREWLSLGDLGNGGSAGLWYVVGSSGTGNAWWYIGSRLSANGRSRGESAA